MHSATGFILKKRAVGEADFLITFFSDKFGKMDAMGRGTRKIESKMASHLQLFDMVEYGFVTGRNYNIITSANSIGQSDLFQESAAKNILRARLMEFLDKFSGEGKNDRFWNRILMFLRWLEEAEISEEKHYEFVSAKIAAFFLEENGLKPQLDECAVCGKNLPVYSGFNYKEGGVVCFSCNRESEDFLVNTDNQTIKSIRGLMSGDGLQKPVYAANVKNAKEILDGFLCFVSFEPPINSHVEHLAKKFRLM